MGRHIFDKMQSFSRVALALVIVGSMLGSAHGTLRGTAPKFSDAERGNKVLVLEAVRQDGLALKYASDVLQADKDVVLAAVTQNGLALAFASNPLKADKVVMLQAMETNGMALAFSSDQMRADKDVVIQA